MSLDILVTGGCGYIGSATARWLRQQGHRTFVVDNLSEGHRKAWDGPFAKLELLDREAVAAFAAGRRFDGIIHFAARCYVGESVQQPLRYWRANVLPVLNLCDAFPGVPFVLSSTCAVYGEPRQDRLDEDHPQAPINPYGATKQAAERVLADRAAAGQGPYAALRYFNASGASRDGSHGEDHDPETHLIPLAVRAALGLAPPLTIFGTDWDTPDGTCIRDYIHVEDLASAHLAALERLLAGGAPGAWNLGTGRGASVLEVVAAVAAASGREVPVVEGARRAGDPARLVANPSRAEQELGWRARWTSLEEIVASAVRWHRSHPEGYAS